VAQWLIVNKRSGHTLGVYQGRTELAAVNAMHRDAGYKNVADAARALNCSVAALLEELSVTPHHARNRR
jgi:hypothetical protein